MKTTTRRLVAGMAVAGVFGAVALSRATLHAATATATLTVQASVNQQCTISNATLNFGSYDPVAANAATDLDAQTNISVACTKGSTGVWVGLGLGSNASGTVRRMGSAGNFLNYELYSNAGRTTVWSNTLATGVNYTPVTSKAATNLVVYGRVPQAQDANVGAYTDSVVATINF
jgi:spore coat protein U-like protein